ncbi:MAG: sulfurtransferase [Cyanobacteria bacterium HKST-UBA06]|nr:sulfurtransferase [Cyanobacteria bacterium HKST-UBA06]
MNQPFSSRNQPFSTQSQPPQNPLQANLPQPQQEVPDVPPPKTHGTRFLDLVEAVKPHINEITVEDLQQWIADGKPVHVIDVREPIETHKGVIGDPIRIPRGVLEVQIERAVPDVTETIVLYCAGGNRSALAAESLGKMGYTSVYSMIGGFRAWAQSLQP